MKTPAGKDGPPSRPVNSPVGSAAAPAEKIEAAGKQSRRESPPCPRLVDDGELSRELDRAQRLVRLVRRDRAESGEPTILRFDPLPSAPPARRTEMPHPTTSDTQDDTPHAAGFSAGQAWSWTLITLGLMGFVCGGVLLAFSLLYERDQFWRIGLPLVLGGQAALILGLVLQMEGLWQNSQQTSHTLDQLDNRLDDLKHATTTLSTTHTPPAATFYAHYSQGASPHLLLADLKGQLDLLAMKLAEQNRK